MNWRSNLIEDEAGVKTLVRSLRRIAVLGIKTEQQAGQAAFYVPQYLAQAGVEIVPVPVYYPQVTEILGKKVFRKVSEVPGELDLVNVFRRPQDIDQHVEDILAKKPKAVWFQLGIRNDAAAEVASLMHHEIRRMAEEDVSTDELNERRTSLLGSYIRTLERSAGPQDAAISRKRHAAETVGRRSGTNDHRPALLAIHP